MLHGSLKIYEVPVSATWHSVKGIGSVSDMYSYNLTSIFSNSNFWRATHETPIICIKGSKTTSKHHLSYKIEKSYMKDVKYSSESPYPSNERKMNPTLRTRTQHSYLNIYNIYSGWSTIQSANHKIALLFYCIEFHVVPLCFVLKGNRPQVLSPLKILFRYPRF